MRWLVMLQRADSRQREIRRLLEELPREMERLSQELHAERSGLQQSQEHLQELALSRRKKEKDLEIEADRIKRSRARLFEVKTNKEYQALLKEIEQGRETNSALEEEILMMMEEMDELAGQLRLQQEALEEREKEVSDRQQRILDQIQELEAEAEQCRQQRERFAAQLENGLVEGYETLARLYAGLAVVRVEAGVCQGCFVNIPPQLYNEILRSGEIVRCPFCTRFLFHESHIQEVADPGQRASGLSAQPKSE